MPDCFKKANAGQCQLNIIGEVCTAFMYERGVSINIASCGDPCHHSIITSNVFGSGKTVEHWNKKKTPKFPKFTHNLSRRHTEMACQVVNDLTDY